MKGTPWEQGKGKKKQAGEIQTESSGELQDTQMPRHIVSKIQLTVENLKETLQLSEMRNSAHRHYLVKTKWN